MSMKSVDRVLSPGESGIHRTIDTSDFKTNRGFSL
jgi:hypothetical protein